MRFARGALSVLVLVLLASVSVPADPPPELDYQGKVLINDLPYTGPGYFKFAIASEDGLVNFWASDGTAAGEPAAHITNTCINGVFSCILGGAPTDDLDPEIFALETAMVLRVWFSSDGATFNEMLPPQDLLSSAYAINADMVDGLHAADIISRATNGVTLSGDVSGTPGGGTTVASLQGTAVGDLAPSSGQILGWNGSAWTNVPASGGGDITAVDGTNGVTGGGTIGAVTLTADTNFFNGRYVRVPGDTMTGTLTMNVGADKDIDIESAGTNVSIGAGADATEAAVAIGRDANARLFAAAVGNQANGRDAGAALGYQANGYWGAAAVGFQANAWSNGVAIGYQADGRFSSVAAGMNAEATDYAIALGRDAVSMYYSVGIGGLTMARTNCVAVGHLANADYYGAACGRTANGKNFGVGVGSSAIGYDHGVAVGADAWGTTYGAAVGRQANGVNYGAALGYQANGNSFGAAVGDRADGYFQGVGIGKGATGRTYAVSVGYYSRAQTYGAAVGSQTFAENYGAALGSSAQGLDHGAAVGYSSFGHNYGAALGENAQGYYYGVAVGSQANGAFTNVAVGLQANSMLGSERISIGHNVTNTVDESARLRGTLYMDGGTALVARSTFGTGAWRTLVPLPPLDNVIWVATNGTPSGPGTIDRPFDVPQNGYNAAAAKYTNEPATLVIVAGRYPGLAMNAGNIHILGFDRPQLSSLTVNSASAFILGKQRVENVIVNGAAVVSVDGGSDVKFNNCRFQSGLQILGSWVEVMNCYARGFDGPAITVGNGASAIEEVSIYNSSFFKSDTMNATMLVESNVYYFEVIGCEIVNYGPGGAPPWAAIEDREGTPLMAPWAPGQVPHLYSHNVIHGAEPGLWMGVTVPAVYDPFASLGRTITFVQNAVWGDVGWASNKQFYANNTVYGDINNTGAGMLWGWGQAGLGSGADTSGNVEHQVAFPGGGGSQRGFPAAWQD